MAPLRHAQCQSEIFVVAVPSKLYLFLDWCRTESGVTRVRTPIIFVQRTGLLLNGPIPRRRACEETKVYWGC